VTQAARVLENKDIRRIVNELTNNNAFIECDPLTGEYKLHKVLQNYLHAKLESSAVDLKATYRRAGKWCVESGDYVTAFNYYHLAGRIEELLDYLNKIEQVDISVLGNDVMWGVCSELPQYLSIKYPILFLQIALNFIFSDEKAMISRGISIIALISDFYGRTEGFTVSLCDKIFAEQELIHAILAFNDIKLMLRHLRKAGELFHGGISSLIFRHSEFTFGLPSFLYCYYKEPGKLKETVDCIAEEHTPLFLDGCGYGCEYLAFAEYALQTGNLVQTEFYAQKTIYKARTKMQVSIELCAYFTLMRLYLLKGDIPKARQLLRDARNLLTERKRKLTDQGNIIYNTTMDLCEGYIYSCLKQSESIPDWLQSGDFSNAVYLFQGIGFPYLVREKAVLLSGN
jgi:LuxR family maltose regulon positive regulatory protein